LWLLLSVVIVVLKKNGYESMSPLVNVVHTLAMEADHEDGDDQSNKDADSATTTIPTTADLVE
jgi:hypothetical protein